MTSIGDQSVDDLPRREVSADEFRLAAIEAGWMMRVVELFLSRPLPRDYVKVGDWMLRVSER